MDVYLWEIMSPYLLSVLVGARGGEGNTKYLCYGPARYVTNAQNTIVTNRKAEVTQIPGCVRVS